ncbi:hypothetical protein V7S43_006048 [Phytophthora oleae]|uniref:Uncharacterized protein n=1 Tax=Phytophthora oleae TaxID=2107226 RepID=A0ABD3FPR6_9STRA
MGVALKFCQRRLADQGETPEIDALTDQLQQLYVGMQLYTARGAVVRSIARTKSKPYNATPVSVTTPGSRYLEIVGGAVETSLRVDAAAFTPRATQVGDSASQSSIDAQARSEDTKTVEPSHLSAGLPANANANNALDGSVSGDRIAGTKEDGGVNSKPAVSASTQINTKTKAFNVFGEPFTPHQNDRVKKAVCAERARFCGRSECS